ncbi:uncharacterized protein LOC114750147 [Neltuma alba]|uniref:uncharacterized protein LOC114750147 n=1 Tax=Neltuma alba TaxID=207710 RepID=UPI0010A3FB8D|nr:uncharacterized protein LOC114750147 [Prosopis alba]
MEKIWDDDYLSAVNWVHNLANLIVEDCRGLKYLFSSSVIGSLLKLKHLEISKCEMMEEIIAPSGIISQEVRFTKLETMAVKDMESLKKVWHFQFDRLKSLEVSNCGKLAKIFPSDMQGTFGSLETLKVTDCGSVEKIFELTAKEIRNEEETTTQQVSQLKKLHLLHLPKLKQIWSKDAQESLCFHNLQLVWVEDCENLEYLFPFYIAMQATQLEDVTIIYAERMKRIISDKEGPMYGPVKFEFNHLTSLVLSLLSELEGLFPGKYSILCPLLRELDVHACWKLKLFKTQSTGGPDRVFDSKLQISTQQPLFTLEEVICNLERLAINSEDASMILQGKLSEKHFTKLKYLTLTSFEDVNTTFPYWFLQNISLDWLRVEYSSFKEIFQEEITTDDRKKFKIRTRLKALSLNELHDLQHICKEGFQLDPVLEVLETLYVDQCSKLKHLVPSSVTFSQLTYLEVENCNGLIHLITSSTARSLVKLRLMKIMNCNSLEQIVAAEEKEGSEDEIAFSSLQILELECLPMIKRFCSSNCVLNLPLLVNVVVKQCPRMRIFSDGDTSTPMLHGILSKKEDEKMYWEGDINRTVNKMFVDMVAFHSFEHLELSQFAELRELWHNRVQPEAYGNLKSLVVQKCDFLSNVLLPSNLVQALSNLEELQVSECDSLETVFDLTNMDRKEVFVKETIPLKRITFSSLLKLKHIWKQNFQETVSFRETTEGHIQHHHPACSIQEFNNLNAISFRIKVQICSKDFLSGNEAADHMAACAMGGMVPNGWLSWPPSSLLTFLQKELRGAELSSVADVGERIGIGCAAAFSVSWPLPAVRFPNLQLVCVEHCETVEYLFPLSIAMQATRLERITIKYAGRMKVIVSRKEGLMDSPIKFEFNHLTSLVLWRLYELEGFFAGSHSVRCPVLSELDVRLCVKLKLFKTQSTSGQERLFDISMQQSLFTLEEV